MIKTIEYTNIKGRTGSHTLGPVTVIQGRNFAGKTTITAAITLACLGYLPALKKTNQATFMLSSGGKMEVTATFGDGRKIKRTWKQSGKTVSQKTEGEAPDLGPVLNPAAFIGADPADRIAMLSALTPEGDDPAVKVLRATLSEPGKVGNVFEMAEALAEGHEVKAKEAGGKVRQWRQTMAGLVELINTSGIPAKPTNFAPAALEAALRAEAAAVKAHEALEEKAEAAWSANDELEAIGQVEAPDAEALRVAYEEQAKATAAASAYLAETRRLLSAAEARAQSLGRAIRAASTVEEVEAKITRIEATEDPTAKLAETAAEAERLRGIVEKLERSAAMAAEEVEGLTNSLHKIEEMEVCPTCKACAPGWKEVARETYGRAIDAAHGRAVDAVAQKGPMAAALEDAEKQRQQLVSIANVRATLPDLRALLTNLRSFAEYQKEAEERAAELPGAEARHAQECEKDRAARAAYDAAVTAAGNAAKIQNLRAVVAAGPSQEDRAAAARRVTDAQLAVTNARAAIEEEQRANKDYEEAMQREKDRASAEIHLAEAEKEQEAEAATAKKIREEMRNAMKSLFGPLLKFAAPLSKSVMGARELTLNSAGEIGVQGDLSFIPFEVLSGTEQLIATIVIQAGLSASVGGVVMVDEFSRVDEENKLAIADALRDMVRAGTLAQVIIVDHDETFAENMAGAGATIIQPV